MSERLLEIDHVSKQYRLGMIGGGLLYRDLNSWIARKLGREDPNRKLGVNTSRDGETFLALDDISFNVDSGPYDTSFIQVYLTVNVGSVFDCSLDVGFQLPYQFFIYFNQFPRPSDIYPVLIGFVSDDLFAFCNLH